MRMRRFGVTAAIDIGLRDPARLINVITVEAGTMTFVLTDHLEVTNGSAVSFATTGYAGRCGSIPSTVEIGFLRLQAYDNRCLAGMTLR